MDQWGVMDRKLTGTHEKLQEARGFFSKLQTQQPAEPELRRIEDKITEADKQVGGLLTDLRQIVS